MRISMTILAGSALLTLAACGGGGDATTSDESTAVTDVDPGEGDGTINDTTLIDGTIGAEEEMGMESRMPADSRSEPSAPAPAAASASREPDPEPSAPAEDDAAEEDSE
ncbi:hypothetical protein [Parasphingopyxis marina]|uniref:Lipoprotein n=1 Tax=Parasphingopyxis marina TaxID=2761622 RepID=A0A842HX14_9SPHN|nr:hypothetical protein [Parasphingopyxis marina]MBC2777435.1 hypothetical protein [Parasphingopyxis marina]